MDRGCIVAGKNVGSERRAREVKEDGSALETANLRCTPEAETLHALLLLLLLLLRRCRDLMLRVMMALRLHHALAVVVPKTN
jgi:hypothetical protein